MKENKDILDFFNSDFGMHSGVKFPICTNIDREEKEIFADFVYLSGVEYCCFEYGCYLDGKLDEILKNPDFEVNAINLKVKVEKGARSSDTLVDKLAQKGSEYTYEVHVDTIREA